MAQARPPASSGDLSELLFSLYQKVASGAMTLSHGLTVARTLAGQSDFGDDGLFPMANGVVGAARGGQLRAAALQWRLVLETLDHAQTTRQRKEVAEGTRAWLYISTYYLLQRPDGRVLADARRRGEQLIAAQLAAGERSEAASLLHDLGVVLSEPYIFGRDDQNFEVQTANWLAQGRAAAMPLELPEAKEMPGPADALAAAADCFQRAADLRSARARGKSLKALSDALIWNGIAGGQLDRPRVAAVMTEAWQLLDPVEDHVIVEMIAQNARSLGLALPEHRAIAVPDSAELERLRLDDPQGYIHALTAAADRATTPRAAIGHLLAGVRFAAETGDEDAAIRFMLHVAARTEALFELRAQAPAADAPVEAWTRAADTLRRLAESSRWPPEDRAMAMLGFGVIASQADREDVAVPLVVEAGGLDTRSQPGLDVAIGIAVAQLSWYYGATHYKAGRFLEACAQYLIAAATAARLGMPGLARRNFGRARDAFNQLGDIADAQVVSAAARSLPRVQSDAPDLADEIRLFWLRVISHAAFTTERLEVLPLAMQAAKGASLAVARAAAAARDVLARPTVTAAIQNWRRATAGPADAPPEPFDEERLLVAYADSLERPGSTPAEQLENLKRRLDRTLASELAKGAPPDAPTLLNADMLRATLPAGTVLVSLYPCYTERGTVAYVSVLASREGVTERRAQGTIPFVDLAIDGVSTDDLATVVSELRKRVLGGASAAEIAGELERAFEYALGAVEDDLAALHRRGYRHLCINPHGALHFSPLPLLGRAGRPLADDWVVTHLPSIGLLAPDDTDPPPRSGAGIFALTFDDARTGLPPLPAAADEARRIGQAVGVAPNLDRAATVQRFEEALRTNRWIHIATHGEHDPASPALQTLYLHSGRRDVAPYRAFEVLQHRLAGLDLVTLSACETALGRIDINDNPRGLQAFLFTAGVATIISCLWPVADDAAAVFFERLYAELAAGRSKLEAYAAAQQAVRARHPAAIDWGAFHYSGRW